MPGLLEEQSTSQDKSKVQGFPLHAGTSSTKQGKGIVLDKDGKPCRTCTSSADWLAMMKSSTSKKSSTIAAASAATSNLTTDATDDADDCPPDVDQLGRSTWTFLHSLTATYPTAPTPSYQSQMSTFLQLFSKFYPCWVCAEDFQTWMSEPKNDVRTALKDQEEFGQWMCRAHNAVNVKLGKKEFDCNLWRQRWKDGRKDGRCD